MKFMRKAKASEKHAIKNRKVGTKKSKLTAANKAKYTAKRKK